MTVTCCWTTFAVLWPCSCYERLP